MKMLITALEQSMRFGMGKLVLLTRDHGLEH